MNITENFVVKNERKYFIYNYSPPDTFTLQSEIKKNLLSPKKTYTIKNNIIFINFKQNGKLTTKSGNMFLPRYTYIDSCDLSNVFLNIIQIKEVIINYLYNVLNLEKNLIDKIGILLY